MKILVDGQLVERNEASVDVEDRGYQFGDGIYEVIRVYKGVLFGLREHAERLFRSAAEIGISLPFSLEDLEWDLQKLVQENAVSDGAVYIQTTRGLLRENTNMKRALSRRRRPIHFLLKSRNRSRHTAFQPSRMRIFAG